MCNLCNSGIARTLKDCSGLKFADNPPQLTGLPLKVNQSSPLNVMRERESKSERSEWSDS
jgi:hypothetical protein